MTSKEKELTISDPSGSEVVELHDILKNTVEPSVHIIKLEEKQELNERENVYNYVSSTAINVFSVIRQMKIEVIMFLYIFSTMTRRISSTTMVIDKVCLVHLGYSEEVCDDLKNYKDIKTEVEKIANNYNLVHSLIQTIPTAILACFIGGWSDKYGRKVPVIIALVGIIAEELGATLSAAIFHSRVEYYLISAIFSGCTGGFIGVLTVLYSYASDTTTFAKRTTKYALMEAAFGLAMPLGQLAGGWIFKFSGYVAVFLVATSGHVLGLAWVLFVLKETRGLDNTDSWRVKFKNFWSTSSVIDSFKTATQKRPNRGREQILLLILSMSIIVLTYMSAGSITFMYVYHQFQWGNTEFSTVSAIFSVIGTITTLISVAIFKKFKVGDATLGLVGVSSLLIKYITMGLANRVEIFFLANILGLLGGLGTLASRSRISKVPSKNDIGKVFAFLTTAESVLPIIAIAVATQVFNATVHIYPGIIFLGVSVILFIPAGVYIWLGRLPSVNYEEIHNISEKEGIEARDCGKICDGKM